MVSIFISIDDCIRYFEKVCKKKCHNINLESLLERKYSKILPILRLADISDKVYFVISFKINSDVNVENTFVSENLPNIWDGSNIRDLQKFKIPFTTVEKLNMSYYSIITIRIYRKENYKKCLKHINSRIRRNDTDISYCRYCNCHEHFLTEKFKKCEKCKKVRYCSKECQIADWKKHKKVCVDNLGST